MSLQPHDSGHVWEILDCLMDAFVLLEIVRDHTGEPADLRYIGVNAVAAEYHRLPREQIVGQSMLKLFPGLATSESVQQFLKTAHEGTPTVLDDFPYLNERYGEQRWYDLRAVQVPAGIALTWRDVTDRHRVAEQLAASERRYRIVVNHIDDVVVYGAGGIAQWVSPSVKELLGWEAQELIGQTSLHMWHPDDVPTAMEIRRELQAGRTGRAVMRIRHRDGHYIWVDVTVSPWSDEGEAGVVSMMRDVGARVMAEQALAESREAYRLLAENAADVVFRATPDGRLDWVSPSTPAVIGWERDDLLGSHVLALVHPQDVPRLREARYELKAGRPVQVEGRFRHGSGRYEWLAATIRPVLDPDSRALIGLVGGARSVQQEVEAREAQRQSDAMLSTAIQAAAIGMAMVDLQGRFKLVNAAMCRIVRREESWLLLHDVTEVIHPMDRLLAGVDLQRMLGGEGDVHVRQLRFVRSDGTTAWVRRAAVLIRGPSGEPSSVLLQVEDVTAEHEAQEKLTYQAFHDSLTGLRNRSWIVDMLDAELRSSARSDTSVGVLFIDLDNFSLVNDSLGHAAGDEMLRSVAELVASVLRPQDHVGRFGGDEFIVLVPGIRAPFEAERVAEQLVEAISSDLVVSGHRIVPTASIGIAVSTPTSTASGLLRDADAALSRAKSAGRARWQFFDDRMHAQAVARLTVEDELRRAVSARELIVCYQPIVTMRGGAVVGHEALVRWRHPQRGLLNPSEFLSVAEDTGLVVPLGNFVLEQVCSMISRTSDLVGNIAVNVSAVQLARDDWRDGFTDTLQRHSVDPRRIVVEVTETAVLSTPERTRDDLVSLRRTGVGVHVDDFGTGFSSISLLCDLPVTGLKLDARFVHDLADETSPARALASALVGLTEGLGLTGIGEGVETQVQADILAAMGWRLGQGYLFGRPTERPHGPIRPRKATD